MLGYLFGMDYIKVAAEDSNAELDANYVEIDLEEDGRISLEALKMHFGLETTGLKYINPTTKAWRLVNCKEGKISPSSCGWQHDTIYYVCCKKTTEEDMSKGRIYERTKFLFVFLCLHR